MAKIRENYFIDIDNESKFVKCRALENNQLYDTYFGDFDQFAKLSTLN